MTTNLTQYNVNGLEFFINTQTGECFASVRGLARMVGVSEGAIRKWAKSLPNTTAYQTEEKMAETLTQPRLETAYQIDLEGVQKIETKKAETLAQPHLEGVQKIDLEGVAQTGVKVPTSTGLKDATLFDEDAILEAIIKYKPKLIKSVLKAGLRVYLYGLAGYQIAPTIEQPTKEEPLTIEWIGEKILEFVDATRHKFVYNAEINAQNILSIGAKATIKALELCFRRRALNMARAIWDGQLEGSVKYWEDRANAAYSDALCYDKGDMERILAREKELNKGIDKYLVTTELKEEIIQIVQAQPVFRDALPFMIQKSPRVSKEQVYTAVSQLEREGKLVYYAADGKIFPVLKQSSIPRISPHSRD